VDAFFLQTRQQFSISITTLLRLTSTFFNDFLKARRQLLPSGTIILELLASYSLPSYLAYFGDSSSAMSGISFRERSVIHDIRFDIYFDWIWDLGHYWETYLLRHFGYCGDIYDSFPRRFWQELGSSSHFYRQPISKTGATRLPRTHHVPETDCDLHLRLGKLE
jgi:hypothetical protein